MKKVAKSLVAGLLSSFAFGGAFAAVLLLEGESLVGSRRL